MAVIHPQYAAIYAQYAAASRHKPQSTMSAIRSASRDGERAMLMVEPPVLAARSNSNCELGSDESSIVRRPVTIGRIEPAADECQICEVPRVKIKAERSGSPCAFV